MKKNSLEAKAAALARKLEQERAGQTLMLGKVVKGQKTTPVILGADPDIQAAFVEHVVNAYARLGTPKGKKLTEWFRRNSVPNASAEVVRLLLRRQLPFTDAVLAGMLEKMARVSFLSLVEFNGQLAQALEKHAKQHAMSERLRKAAARFADVLAVRNVTAAEAKFWKEEWGFPSAEDRKIAGRIDQALRRRY